MKRLLAFLLLLAVGAGALYLAVANDTSAGAGGGATGEPRDDGARQPPATGIPLGGRSGASVTQMGALTIPQWRAVPLGGGRVRMEEVFVLRAEDSQPVGEGLQRLDGVEVKLFDSGKHTATLTATQAFVTLTRDDAGELSLSEGKEIDMRSAVLTAVPGSRLGGLRLELGDAKVKVADGEVLLTTQRDQPVLMVVEGERQATLRGRGALARLPRDRDGALQRAEIEILQDPVLEAQDVVVRAKGPLRYVEDLARGIAQVTVDDTVQVEFTGSDLALPGMPVQPGGNEAAAGTKVWGDRFTGWLLRDKEVPAGGRERHQVLWRQLVLTGAPAQVQAQGGLLSTPRLTVLPGLSGAPFLVTAHGGTSRIEQTELRPDSRQRTPMVGTAAERLHLVRFGEYAGAPYRAFGFPRWTLRPLDDLQVVIGEGASRFASDLRTIEASDGVRAYRSGRAETGVVRGRGKVRVTRGATSPSKPDLVATGDDGFLLTVEPEREALRLGGAEPMAFDVRYGDAWLQGHGTCDVTRAGDDTWAHVVSPAADLVAAMPDQGLELRRVHDFTARLAGDDVVELDAAGWPLELVLSRTRNEEKVHAFAPRLQQLGPRALRLLPVPHGAPAAAWPIAEPDRLPRVSRSARRHADLAPEVVEVRGPEIHVHHAGGDDALVEAFADGADRARVYAVVPQRDHAEPTTIACDAERLRLLPFVLTPDAQAWHARAGGPFANALFHTVGKPWLIVDDVRDLQLDDAGQGHIQGHGKRVLVSQGGRAALFVGDAEAMAPAEVRRRRDGREVTLRGARVRAFDAEEVRLDALGTFADHSTFLLPTMTLHEAGRKDLLSHVRASCVGNIEVRSEAVVFGGPVVAQGLRPDGSVDPDGIHIDAKELTMRREPASGDIVRVLARHVTLDWTRLDAICTDLEIDVPNRRCIVSDPRDAVVDLANGWRYLAPRLEIDYETLAIGSFQGRVFKRDDTMDGAR